MDFRRLNSQDFDAYYSNRIRAVTQSPLAFIATLDEEAHGGTQHYYNTLSHGGDEWVIFGALDKSEVVGAVGIFVETQFKLKHKSTVWGMFVDEAYRGQGIGGRMLDMAISHARLKQQARVVYLNVSVDNESAIKLYQSRGFVAWGREPRAVCNGGVLQDDFHMGLSID